MAHTIKPALLSRNFTEGRSGQHPVDMIVIHVTEGDAESVVSWFNNVRAKVSAHYLVRADGKILQFVSEEDTAWHAGHVDHATARLVRERITENPNDYSIGIEHEGDGRHELTSAQRVASVSLIADICSQRGIPIDRDHIIGHHEIYAPKTCPGAIDVDRLVAVVGAYGAAPVSGDTWPRIVWSPQLNDHLVVVRYASDADWSFVRLSQLSTLASTRAGTPLSRMPLAAT